MTTEELENYEPKGDLIGFPKEIIARMLECQEEQGTPRDISVFERDRTAGQYVDGFARYKTKEGNRFWYEVINNKDFNPFFEKYPKQDNLKINNKMTTEELESYTPKGELECFPKEVISRMLDYQEEQGNPRDISVFERDRKAGRRNKGFSWDKTKEGKTFWNEVIYTGNCNLFYEKYPKQDNLKATNKMTAEELESYTPKGNLKRFPKEIISRMLDCQEEQGNPRDVSIFENRVTSEQYNKGFAWDETKEGYNFWYDVINNKDFNLFFEKYPKQDYQDSSQKFRVGEEFDLESYSPKGELQGFPKEIISRMLECQEEQGNPRDVSVFENQVVARRPDKGFEWDKTKEDKSFWYELINNKDFNLFFEKYPKQDNLKINNKMTTEELESYTPKGNLKRFPKEIIARMLECQEEQGNPRDVSVFEKQCCAGRNSKGFAWDETKEGEIFWNDVIGNKDFNLFFKKYPKQDYQDNPQEFRVGDEVINIITGRRGKISQISTNDIYVNFNEEGYTLDGRYYVNDKYPRLLHYRNDYDYSIINFNNLPERQEPKRWRAEKEGEYYTVRFYVEGLFFTYAPKDNNSSIDNINYNSGNYFRTEAEAKNIAQKLNTYFKQLIQEEHGKRN